MIILDGYPFKECRNKNGVQPNTYGIITKHLVEKYRVCYWCNVPVLYIGKVWKKGERIPKNMATIDHLVSRFFRKPGDVVPKVLCCFACNQRRAKNEDKEYRKQHIENKKTTAPISQVFTVVQKT